MARTTNHPTRERILHAAIELMWQHGYRRTSPAQVMQASEVGQGSFYHHFEDKRSLGLAVVEYVVERTIESVDDVFGADLPPLEQVRSWVRTVTGKYRPPCDRGCPLGKLGLEMANEDPAFRERIAGGFSVIRRRIAGALRHAEAVGQLDPFVSPDALADLLLSSVEGAILIAQCDGEPGPMDRCLQAIENLLDRVSRPGVIIQSGVTDP
jgi:TetR/AcrR family transcriptional regulator, transcriptional repressor for nem operon